MHADVTVRPATQDDLHAYDRVMDASGLGARPGPLRFLADLPVSMPYVAEDESGRVVGTGLAVAHEGTGWLGLISVAPHAQNRGVGRALTAWGLDALAARGVESVQLASTPRGYVLYERLGFVSDGTFLSYCGPGLPPDALPPAARPLVRSDWRAVEALDHEATGERRGRLLRSLGPGVVVEDGAGRLTGFHLATPWGSGVTVAESEAVGAALLDAARALAGRGGAAFVLPRANLAARAHLARAGFRESGGATAMVRGARPAPFVAERVWGLASLAAG